MKPVALMLQFAQDGLQGIHDPHGRHGIVLVQRSDDASECGRVSSHGYESSRGIQGPSSRRESHRKSWSSSLMFILGANGPWRRWPSDENGHVPITRWIVQ